MDSKKNREEKALQLYNFFWDSYIKGDLESFASTLDEEFEMIGTSESEIAHNKAEGIAFFKDQLEEVIGKADMRNRQISSKSINDLVFINESCDIYVYGEPEWTFYSKIRISTFLRETESGWKVLQQHGSLPDMRVQEGETMAIEKINRENLELRDAVKRRTIELENKSRELEIEASLERVRGAAMGMKKAEDLLDVCKVISNQLEDFEVDQIRNIQIAIIDEKAGLYTCYQYFPAYKETIIEETEYLKNPVEQEMVLKMLASRDGHFMGHMEGKALKEFEAHRKEENHFPDPLIEESSELGYCFLSIGEGGLGITRYKTIKEEELNLFKRFHQVFSLAYQRFRDIQKAEAQARESDIQLALERVRARTMAMQHSDELTEASQVLDQQVRALGIDTWGCAFHIYADDPEGDYEWFSSKAGTLPFYKTPRENFFLKFYEKGKAGETFHVEEFLGEACKAHYEYIMTIPVMGDALREVVASGGSLPESQYDHIAFFKHGFLLFITYQPVPEAHDIFQRFSKVFEQTYTRFLDLQKAEAQAREAQIEAALERIRSRSMAMHKTSELSEVILVLFKQFEHLNLVVDTCYIDIFDENNQAFNLWIGASTAIYPKQVRLPYFDHPIHNLNKDARENGIEFFTFDEDKKSKKVYFDHFYPNAKGIDVPEDRKEFIAQGIGMTGSSTLGIHSGITMFNYQKIIYSEEENIILKRMNKVFQQTYTRFLDLQKAEEQAREAQIEVALERVRAAAMAMRHSEDLKECTKVVFDELEKLELNMERSGIGIFDPDTRDCQLYTTVENPEGKKELSLGVTSLTIHPLLVQTFEAWEKQEALSYTLEGKDLKNYYDIVSHSEFILSEEVLEKSSALPKEYYHYCPFSAGGLYFFSDIKPTAEDKTIIKRFAEVFDLTYTRFLDLQKAEAQAKENQIQLALERIRARTMAMQKSEELSETASVLFQQFIELGYETERINIGIIREDQRFIEFWSTEQGGNAISQVFKGSIDEPTSIKKFYEGWVNKEESIEVSLEGEELKNWMSYVIDVLKIPTQESLISDRRFHTCAYFSNGLLISTNPKPLLPETLEILKRFAKVFEQTYTRFLDLQKAEAQAREAQIESALERVRSKTMAMHTSQDVGNTMVLLFDELRDLGIQANRSGVLIMNKDGSSELWTAKINSENIVELFPWKLDMSMNHMTLAVYEGWKNQENLINYLFEGKDRKDYYQTLNESPDIPIQFNIEELSEREFTSACYFKEGGIYIFSPERISEDHANILARFASGFGQTYRRYLDLVLAETRTREAQIEAALERVRAKAMAMHSSSDLSDASSVVFDELRHLGIVPLRSGIGLIDKATRRGTMFAAHSAGEGNTLSLIGEIKLSNHELLDNIFENWLKKEIYTPVLNGEELESYYDLLLSSYEDMPKPKFSPDEVQYGYFIPFTHGSFYSWTNKPFEKEELSTIKKFGSVIDLTYKRFCDLQQAEERALAATRQASFDRVRGEIASMRTTSDLNRITPLIWQELTHLGVPFFRCGIFIIKEDEKMVHAYLSTPTGEALAGLHIGFEEEEIGMIKPSIENWRQQKIYTEEWDKELFLRNMQNFIRRGDVKNPKKYQAGDTPPERLVLHLVPFRQGMLYVGNSELLEQKQIELVQTLADSFSVAYSRYEDFNALENAKSKIENTLTELKAAQEQLVQQEKLASLGQLTAGIAHEIKNPLNFVNNFSDLSCELIDEVFEELEKLEPSETKEEIIAILEDVKSNLSRVHEHGTRADGIVKSMLQHSRASGSKREPTAFNPLVQEFVNLSFHGMRAAKSPINVEIDVQLDPDVGDVTLISEDFSRVILNLCNNAFDAMRDKLKQTPDYLPKLTVKTSLENDNVILSIADNGPGIPEEIRDKILQPFFTTKKGTEGTGLGLSITHDIIKAHGGELRVENKSDTEMNKGTTFLITLPISKN
ncbi:ATP-binding protein [Algoriphagus sediminis]|uniref:histidine kinase n=1 Tax=Algoriphagus sediminis TaxID=3057113 RepID=A0ABT7YCA6_9BACT|nr:ATP-binding protein [Algoriphagus sediminis]MDN3204101.1 ATP-binding protein [Algoriphagus sediminis]